MNWMTVTDLIAHLQKLPGGTIVVYRKFSDWSYLQPDDIDFDADRTLMVGANGVRPVPPQEQWPDGFTPCYASVVVFPGN